MAKVYAPLQGYNGISASVTFVNGVGETDNENLLEWFEEKGYTVEREKPKRAKKSKEVTDETSEGATEEVAEGATEEVAEEATEEVAEEVSECNE